MGSEARRDGPWGAPRREDSLLYPGLTVCDNRVTGSITVGRSRLPLWAFIWNVVNEGYGEANRDHDRKISEYGMSPEALGAFLVNPLEMRGDFGRLLLVLADAEREEQRRAERGVDVAWWEHEATRRRIAKHLRLCLEVVE